MPRALVSGPDPKLLRVLGRQEVTGSGVVSWLQPVDSAQPREIPQDAPAHDPVAGQPDLHGRIDDCCRRDVVQRAQMISCSHGTLARSDSCSKRNPAALS